jgi:hypothetical protein
MITRAVQAANSVGIFISWLEFVACEGEEASFNQLTRKRQVTASVEQQYGGSA